MELPADRGMGGSRFGQAHAECETRVIPPHGDVQGQMDPGSVAQGSPGWRQDCGCHQGADRAKTLSGPGNLEG